MKKWLSGFVLTLAIGGTVNAKTYDVYEATTSAAASSPVVVFVHGGAWQSGSKEQYRWLGEALAKEKICAVIAGYTLTPKAKHPQPVEELEKTIKDITSQKQGRCSWDRVYLVGHSAGAHMIAMWNATYTNPSVKGFVGLEGIYDIERLINVWPGYKDWFIAKEFGADEKKWKQASPRGLTMKSKAPWLVVHSEKDELVDLAQSTDFDEALRKQGVPMTLLKTKAGSHFDVVESLRDPNAEVTRRILEFVRRP